MESQSAAGWNPAPAADNEQMEFLGDAVLSFVVSQELFRRFPEYQEGRAVQAAGAHRQRTSLASPRRGR